MDRIKITGGAKLNGTIPISGAKNAALPLIIAALLTEDRLTLKNVPNLADVNLLARIMRNHGVDLAVDGKRPGVAHQGETFHLTAREITDTVAPYELVFQARIARWRLGRGSWQGLTQGVGCGAQRGIRPACWPPAKRLPDAAGNAPCKGGTNPNTTPI